METPHIQRSWCCLHGLRENLRTLRLMSLVTELPPPLVGWYAIPDDGKFGEGRLMTYGPSTCLERHDVPSQSHCAEKSRFADDIGELFEEIE